LVLALSLSSGCSHTEDSVGFVLEKHGDWYLEKHPQRLSPKARRFRPGQRFDQRKKDKREKNVY
jgi:hypothetical protein